MATLPQFSRNYGSRGGAYERPTTVVDTPSSNPWAKAIETMGRITAEQIAKRSKNNSAAIQQTQKYLDENAKFLLDSYDEFSGNMEKVGVNNPSLNRVGLFAIEKKANAYMSMKSARSREEQAAFAKEYAFWDGKINELNITVQAGKDADADFITDYLDGYAKVNMPNGISTVNMNEGLSKQYQLAMPARTGTTRNPKEQWFFDKDDNWKLKLMYTSDQITGAFEKGEIDNNYIVADPKVLFAFDGGKIDDLASASNKFLQMLGKETEKDRQKINEVETVPANSKSWTANKVKEKEIYRENLRKPSWNKGFQENTKDLYPHLKKVIMKILGMFDKSKLEKVNIIFTILMAAIIGFVVDAIKKKYSMTPEMEKHLNSL